MANKIKSVGGNLYRLAAQQLGDATQFIRLMDANNISDPMLNGLYNLTIPATSPVLTGGLPDIAIQTPFDSDVLPTTPDPQPDPAAPQSVVVGGVLVVIPGQPLNLTINDYSSGQSVLTWTAPVLGSGPFAYTVQIRLSNAGNWATYASGVVGTTQIISPPTAASYDFRVAAVNTAATGPFSATVSQDYRRVIAPANLSIGTITPTSIQVLWSTPQIGSQPIHYTITDQKNITHGTFILGTSSVVTGLTSSTNYTFTVTAANNFGTSAPSQPISAQTSAPVGGAKSPTNPTGVTQTASDTTTTGAPTGRMLFAAAAPYTASVTLTWLASTGTQPVTYTVYYQLHNSGGTWTPVPEGTTELSYTVTGLEPGTSYDFQIRSSNAGPRVGYSTTLTTTTPIDPTAGAVIVGAGSPFEIGVVTDTSIQLAWPLIDPTVISYTLLMGTDPTALLPYAYDIPDMGITVTGLTADTIYYFALVSRNAVNSSRSDIESVSTALLPLILPTPPMSVTAIPVLSGTDMSVSWLQPLEGTLPFSYGTQYRIAGTGTGLTATPQLLPEGFISTRGNQFIDENGNPVRICAGAMINGEAAATGVGGQFWRLPWRNLIDGAKACGLNCIAYFIGDYAIHVDPLMFSDSADDGFVNNSTINPEFVGRTALQCLDLMVDYAGSIGLKFIIVKAGNEPGPDPGQIGEANLSGLWYGDTGYSGHYYTSNDVKANLIKIAARYAGNSTVIGLELNTGCTIDPAQSNGGPPCTFNSNDASTDIAQFWTDVGNAVGAVNPDILVIAGAPSGVFETPDYLSAMAFCDPLPNLNIPNKLAYAIVSTPAVTQPGGVVDLSIATQQHSYGFIFEQNLAPIIAIEVGFPNDFTGFGDGIDPDQEGCLSWVNAIFTSSGYFNMLAGIPSDGFGISWCWFALNPSGPEGTNSGPTDTGYSLLAYSDGLTPLDPPRHYLTPNLFYGSGQGSVPWTQGADEIIDLSTTISGLVVNTRYEIQVSASNRVGTSDWSPSAVAITGDLHSQQATLQHVYGIKAVGTSNQFGGFRYRFGLSAVGSANNAYLNIRFGMSGSGSP